MKYPRNSLNRRDTPWKAFTCLWNPLKSSWSSPEELALSNPLKRIWIALTRLQNFLWISVLFTWEPIKTPKSPRKPIEMPWNVPEAHRRVCEVLQKPSETSRNAQRCHVTHPKPNSLFWFEVRLRIVLVNEIDKFVVFIHENKYPVQDLYWYLLQNLYFLNYSSTLSKTAFIRMHERFWDNHFGHEKVITEGKCLRKSCSIYQFHFHLKLVMWLIHLEVI